MLARGLVVTVEIAALSLVIGIALGLVLAVARVAITRKSVPLLVRGLNLPIAFYVDSIRAIPPLVTLVAVYFALPYHHQGCQLSFGDRGFRSAQTSARPTGIDRQSHSANLRSDHVYVVVPTACEIVDVCRTEVETMNQRFSSHLIREIL